MLNAIQNINKYLLIATVDTLSGGGAWWRHGHGFGGGGHGFGGRGGHHDEGDENDEEDEEECPRISVSTFMHARCV